MQSSHIKQHVPAFAHQRSGFLRAMSDAGLKPTVVHHNLTPAELYEQVCPALTDSTYKYTAPSEPRLDPGICLCNLMPAQPCEQDCRALHGSFYLPGLCCALLCVDRATALWRVH